MLESVLLGFGSNLGDRRRILESAWTALGDEPDIETVRISGFHETRPVGGPPDQPDYLNAAGTILTSLEPEALLDRLQRIEARFGRERTQRWGARTLDLDILLFGRRIVSTPRLTIPHPEMHRRAFVLIPATEIEPDRIHPPTGLTLLELRARSQESGVRS